MEFKGNMDDHIGFLSAKLIYEEKEKMGLRIESVWK